MLLCLLALASWIAHFSPFDIGQIKAHAYHGLSADRIAEILVKPKRGPGRKKLHWTKGAVQRIINKLEDEPGWRGEREEGSGATRNGALTLDREYCGTRCCGLNPSFPLPCSVASTAVLLEVTSFKKILTPLRV